MISALDSIVESRIDEALARGEFDDLPGAGKPLQLDDDPLVPKELRVAYRVLKNAGFEPPQVTKLREAANVRAALASACDELTRPDAARTRRLQRRLAAICIALDAHGVDLSRLANGAYYHQSVNKLAGSPD